MNEGAELILTLGKSRTKKKKSSRSMRWFRWFKFKWLWLFKKFYFRKKSPYTTKLGKPEKRKRSDDEVSGTEEQLVII
jgi:hypothetical protein